MFGPGASAFIDKQGMFYILTNWLLLLLAILGSSKRGSNVISHIIDSFNTVRTRKAAAGVVYIGIFLISIVYMVTESFNPFLYFRF